MKKYLIKREMPGISQTPQDKLEEAGKNSESVLRVLIRFKAILLEIAYFVYIKQTRLN